MYYIYAHIRLDTNEIFYIGKGSKNRAWFKHNRNNHWNNIVNTYGYTVEILAQFKSEQEALKQEINCIKYLDRLCNMTVGGDGVSGMTHSKEAKAKMSLAKKGKVGNRLGSIVSEDTRRKLSEALKGRPSLLRGVKLSEETKEKLRIVNTGKIHSEETKAKISLGNFGKKHTSETRDKISKANLGEKSHNFKGIIQYYLPDSLEIFELSGKKQIKELGFDAQCVYACVNGKQKMHKGYIFKRVPKC